MVIVDVIGVVTYSIRRICNSNKKLQKVYFVFLNTTFLHNMTHDDSIQIPISLYDLYRGSLTILVFEYCCNASFWFLFLCIIQNNHFLIGNIYFKGIDFDFKFTLICIFLIGYYRNWLNNTLGCVFFVHITYHVSVRWCRWLPTSNWFYFLPAFFNTIYFILWSSPLQNVATAYEHVNEKYSI